MKGIISVSALLLKKYRKSSKGRGNPPVVSLQKWEKGRGYLLELFQSYSVMRAPAKTAVQRLKEANRGFKMTVTEMNVCFEAALLQCTKAGRMLLVLGPCSGLCVVILALHLFNHVFAFLWLCVFEDDDLWLQMKKITFVVLSM